MIRSCSVPIASAFHQAVCSGANLIPLAQSWPADLETPLTTWIKVGDGRPPGVLLESVEGGETLGALERDRLRSALDGVGAQRSSDDAAGEMVAKRTLQRESIRIPAQLPERRTPASTCLASLRLGSFMAFGATN